VDEAAQPDPAGEVAEGHEFAEGHEAVLVVEAREGQVLAPPLQQDQAVVR